MTTRFRNRSELLYALSLVSHVAGSRVDRVHCRYLTSEGDLSVEARCLDAWHGHRGGQRDCLQYLTRMVPEILPSINANLALIRAMAEQAERLQRCLVVTVKNSRKNRIKGVRYTRFHVRPPGIQLAVNLVQQGRSDAPGRRSPQESP
jgi:hypothetical protein